MDAVHMDTFEKIGYLCLGAVALIYLGAMLFVGTQVGWFGVLIGLLVVVGVGVLLIKVIKERRANAEDDYYARNIDK
jgi:hypothetical protein